MRLWHHPCHSVAELLPLPPTPTPQKQVNPERFGIPHPKASSRGQLGHIFWDLWTKNPQKLHFLQLIFYYIGVGVQQGVEWEGGMGSELRELFPYPPSLNHTPVSAAPAPELAPAAHFLRPEVQCLFRLMQSAPVLCQARQPGAEQL